MLRGGIPRGGKRHPIARFERGEKSQLERGRGTGRHHDLARIDCETVLRAVMSGDHLAQGCDAERVGITDRFVRQRVPGRLAHGFGRLGPRLADFEMDHIGAVGLSLIGGAQQSMAMKGGTSPRRDTRKLIRAAASTRASPNRV